MALAAVARAVDGFSIGGYTFSCTTDCAATSCAIESAGRGGAVGTLLNVFDVKLTVVENTPKVHNVIVCTLCSCYPRMLLGMPPAWYKSRAYRARLVREPRAVLREFGTVLPDDVAVRVHDSTADLRYVVLPMRPEGSEGLTEAELARLVSRDSMVGVMALPAVKA